MNKSMEEEDMVLAQEDYKLGEVMTKIKKKKEVFTEWKPSMVKNTMRRERLP